MTSYGKPDGNNADISVIIPVYNVKEYLNECLDSLADQGNVSLQVILIDDGSTDGSTEILKAYADTHENCEYLRFENKGVGFARNEGVKLATGEYIIFLDGDDVVVQGTYEKMLEMARSSGAEMTICNVIRFNSIKKWPSILHSKVFRNIKTITHINEYLPFIYDTTSWNKLILRSFYERIGLAFPEGIFYEDIPFSAEAHLSCNKVAVMSEMGYMWRVRESANRSITQRTGSSRNLYDRLTALQLADEVFAEKGCDGELLLAHQAKALEDLIMFVDECDSLPEVDAYEVLKKINEYIDKAVPEEAFGEISLLNRQKFEYVRKYDLSGLKKLLGYKDYKAAPVTERDGSLYADLPGELFTIADRDVTKEIRTESHVIRADAASDEGTSLMIDVTACRSREPEDSAGPETEAFLIKGETKIRLRTEVLGNKGKSVRLFVDANEFNAESVEAGRYSVLVCCRDRWGESCGTLKIGNGKIRDDYNSFRLVTDRLSMQIDISAHPELGIIIEKDPVVAESLEISNDELQLRIGREADTLVASSDEQGESLSVELEKDHSGLYTLDCSMLRPCAVHTISERGSGRKVLSKERVTKKLTGDWDYIITSPGDSCLRIRKLHEASFITASDKKGKKISVSISKHCADDKDDPLFARLTVEDKMLGEYICLSDEAECCRRGEDIFSDPVMDLSKNGLINDLYESRREILVEYSYKDGKRVREQLYSVDEQRRSVTGKNVKAILYKSDDAAAMLRIFRFWSEEESTFEKRVSLIEEKYPEFRKQPLKKTRILFQSTEGAHYGGRPREVYEYMDSRFPEYECIWALSDPGTPVKGRAKKVRYGSVDYYRILATAAFIVTDCDLPGRFVRRDGQQLIQGEEMKIRPDMLLHCKYIIKQQVKKYIRRGQK